MAWDPVAEIAHVDDLIDRVTRALGEARGHGNTILVDLNESKLAELIKLREVLAVPRPRDPDAE